MTPCLDTAAARGTAAGGVSPRPRASPRSSTKRRSALRGRREPRRPPAAHPRIDPAAPLGRAATRDGRRNARPTRVAPHSSLRPPAPPPPRRSSLPPSPHPILHTSSTLPRVQLRTFKPSWYKRGGHRPDRPPSPGPLRAHSADPPFLFHQLRKPNGRATAAAALAATAVGTIPMVGRAGDRRRHARRGAEHAPRARAPPARARRPRHLRSRSSPNGRAAGMVLRVVFPDGLRAAFRRGLQSGTDAAIASSYTRAHTSRQAGP